MGQHVRIFANDEEAKVHAEIAALVERSRKAQAQIEHYTQEQVDALIRAMVWSVAREDVAKQIHDRLNPFVIRHEVRWV